MMARFVMGVLDVMSCGLDDPAVRKSFDAFLMQQLSSAKHAKDGIQWAKTQAAKEDARAKQAESVQDSVERAERIDVLRDAVDQGR
jgi:poly-gamma-glutamate capsule biosynthesis protein CapA/YwtB (metallophosphatase superfamily)